MDRRRQLIEAILRPSAPKPGGPILDLNQVPSPDAQAGLLSGMLQNYQPGMADYARSAEGIARGAATAAPEAIVKAYEDPSLATVSSAAGQTALTFGKPLQAAGIAGMGLLGAMADDAGLFGSEAQAGKKKATEPAPTIPGYTPEQQAVFSQAWDKKERGDFKSGVDRRAAEKAVQDGLDFMSKNAEREAVSKQAEYDRKVGMAEASRDQELARQKRFSDTETGKWYEKNATWLPFAAAVGGGLLSRAFTGPGKSTVGKAFKEYVLPMATGTTVSYGAQNAPEIYDMSVPPAVNPEKEAYRKYAFNLPDGHPDKAKATAYAESLPDVNPVKSAAQESLQQNAPMRMLAAGLEGVSLGKLGAGAAGLPGRLTNDAAAGFKNFRSRAGGAADEATSPGGTGAGPQQTGPAAAGQNSQSYRTYNDLPENVRQEARDAYVVDRALSGGAPSPKAAADGYRKVFADNGINVPVTPARIKATNDAVSRFVQANGREPMGPADWSKIFNDKTLLVALGAGVGAGAMSGGSGEAEAADPQRAMLVDLIRRVQAGEI